MSVQDPHDAPRPGLVLPFLGALVLGPLLTAIASYVIAFGPFRLLTEFAALPDLAYLLLAPSLGLLFGLPYYATLGALAFVIAIGMGRVRVRDFAIAGFLANLASPLLSLPFYQSMDYALTLLFYGSVAAPVWGAGFGLVFRWFGGARQC